MDTNLLKKIRTDILQREKIRKREKAKKELERRLSANDEILKLFEETLKLRLNCLQEFKYFEVSEDDAKKIFNFKKNAKVLGFDCYEHYEWDTLYPFSYYVLYVSPYKKGIEKTLPQQKLEEFNKQLTDKRNRRKEELIAECNKVKEKIENGDYNYTIYKNLKKAEISVKSEKTATFEFEQNIVKDFFSSIGLECSSCINSMWKMAISMK